MVYVWWGRGRPKVAFGSWNKSTYFFDVWRAAEARPHCPFHSPIWPSNLPLLPSSSLRLCPTIFVLCGLSCLLRPYLRAAVWVFSILLYQPYFVHFSKPHTFLLFVRCVLYISFLCGSLHAHCGLFSQCACSPPLNLSFSNPSIVCTLHSTTTVLFSLFFKCAQNPRQYNFLIVL